MKWLPKNFRPTQPKPYKPARPCLGRSRQKDPEKSINWRNEFDMFVQEKYNGMSNEDRNFLWQHIGSILIINNTGSSRNPQDRLTLALKIFQEQSS